MSLIVAALLSAISVIGGAWYFIHTRDLKQTVSSRLAATAAQSHLAFPYDLDKQQSSLNPVDGISLDESFENKLTRRLYLAGFRSKKSVSFFSKMHLIGYGIPFLLIGIAFLNNEFSKTSVVQAVLSGMGFIYVTNVVIKGKRKNFERSISRALPQFLDLLVVSIEAGLNFTAALPRVLNEMEPTDPLAQEFRVIHHEYLGGLSIGQSCERAIKRCDVPDLSIIMSAIVESEQTGSSLANVLRIHSHDLYDKYRQRLREKAHKLPIKLLFPMMLIFITIFTMALGPTVYRMKTQNKEFEADEKRQKEEAAATLASMTNNDDTLPALE